ncbi:hypothetical protein M405DRAFT_208626 [Rhizopogon salebrosus TDB-379]|nr:hypothetical protein M405DRAFT_208626 [Rhizopogon salebrosus TDB-379]
MHILRYRHYTPIGHLPLRPPFPVITSFTIQHLGEVGYSRLHSETRERSIICFGMSSTAMITSPHRYVATLWLFLRRPSKLVPSSVSPHTYVHSLNSP